MRNNDGFQNGAYEWTDQYSYEAWTPGTRVQLCNVPWSSDYQDAVTFSGIEERNAYFAGLASQSVSIERMTLAVPGMPVRISVPHNKAYRYNYLVVTNHETLTGDIPRTFYYFIQDVRYVAPNTTELVVMLDVWQTFLFDVHLSRAYVEQGHYGIAEQTLDDAGSDVYQRRMLLEPEGFETGSDMVVLSSSAKPIGTTVVGDSDSEEGVDILVWSNTDLGGDWGTVDDPKMTMSTGSYFQGLPQGATCYVFKDATDFTNFTSKVAKAPWVAQGIVSIQVVPNGLYAGGAIAEVAYNGPAGSGTVNELQLVGRPIPVEITLEKDFRASMRTYMGKRYRHLHKFMTAPYCMAEVTAYTGAPLMLRPECIYGKDLVVRRFADLGLPSPRIVFTPMSYNSMTPQTVVDGVGEDYFKLEKSDFLDTQTGVYNFPTLSILNNSYLAYMSSNAHSIAFQHSSADWSQTKAMTGNQLSFDQSTAGIGLANRMNDIGNKQATISTGIGNVGNAAGVVGSLASRDIGGAARNGAAIATSAASLANNVHWSNERTKAGTENSAYMRDTNKAYADFAAKGDYSQAIASINARTQDMKVVSPTTIGQVGGEQFALINLHWMLFAKVKAIQPAALQAIGEYWLRYGYRVNRPVAFNNARLDVLNVMSRFSYWRTSETYLASSSCPEQYRMSIRGILEKGVTVWRNPADIGVVDPADNDPSPTPNIFRQYSFNPEV